MERDDDNDPGVAPAARARTMAAPENENMTISERNELCRQARMTFWKVAKNCSLLFMEQAPAAYKGPDAALYRTECAMVKRHLEPLYWGTFVSLFLFGTFRISGSRWYARFREGSGGLMANTARRSSAPHSAANSIERTAFTKPHNSINNSSSINSSSSSSNSHSNQQWKSYLDTKAENASFLRDEAMQLPTDILVSLLCGMSSVLWLSQPQQIKQDLAEAPLQPGKSVIVDCFCPDMQAAFESVAVASAASIATKDVMEQDDTLRTFFALVHNCRLRAEYTRLQTAQGNPRPDVVPYPGLDGVRKKA